MKRFKVLNIAVFIILALMTIGTAVIFYWLITPTKPILEVTNAKVLNPTVKQGGTFLFDYDYCKHEDTMSGQVVRYFKDQIITYLPTIPSNAKKGCGHSTLSVEIPPNLAVDKYTYNYEVTYKVNPIKTVTYYFESPQFEVIK